HQIAQHVGDGVDLVGIYRIGGGILGGEFRDRGLRAARTGQQIAAIGLRQEIRRTALDDSQSVYGQIHVGDHLPVEQAHRVGGNGIPEPRVEFLGDGGAAHDRAFLHDLDFQPASGKVECANQAVVSGANNKNIIAHLHASPVNSFSPVSARGVNGGSH